MIWGQILLKRGGNDEDIKAQRNLHEPVQVPVDPVTRARAKRFKEELNKLVQRVLQQEESLLTTDGDQRSILLIKFDPEDSQEWYGRFYSPSLKLTLFSNGESSQDFHFKSSKKFKIQNKIWSRFDFSVI